MNSSYDRYAAKMDEKLNSMWGEEYDYQSKINEEFKEAKRKSEIAAMEAALRQNRASKRVIPSTNPCSEVFVGNNPIQVNNHISAAVTDANASLLTQINNQNTALASRLSTVETTVYPGKIQMSEYTFSTARGDVTVSQGFAQGLKVDFDEAVWTISVPGVLKEEIKVFTVKDRVYVDIEKAGVRQNRFQFILAEDEKVTATKLDLGILSVTIDRPAKRQEIEVG